MPTPLHRLVEAADAFFRGRPREQLTLIAGLALLAVFVVDIVTIEDLHVTAFYLVPIFLTSWYVSGRMGVIFALLSGASYQAAEYFGRTGGEAALLVTWNTAVIAVTFCANAMSIAQLRAMKAAKARAEAALIQALKEIERLSALKCL